MDSAPFKVASTWAAALSLAAFGKALTFTYGTGPDHGRFDVYVNGTLWQSFDGYAALPGEASATVTLTEEGWHVFEIRNAYDKTFLSTGYKLRFKSLVASGSDYVQNDISYEYDNLARLISAVYAGSTTYTYGYDVAGNLTNNNGIARTYNAANRLANAGFTYDANGNMTSDGTNTYTWDRANRLLSMGGISYAYNGDGNRVSQTASSVVTKYLLDLQPGLPLVIAETTSGNTKRFIHSPRGIHMIQDAADNWHSIMQDGLESIRSVVDADGAVLQSMNYTPYGVPDAAYPWAFTGEQRDGTGIQYHRARYYNPALGTWASLDPFEGLMDRAMSLNGYSWVEGNTPNSIDPTGRLKWDDWSIGGFLIEQNDCISCIAKESGVFDPEYWLPPYDEANIQDRNWLIGEGPSGPFYEPFRQQILNDNLALFPDRNINYLPFGQGQRIIIPPALTAETKCGNKYLFNIWANGLANQGRCRCPQKGCIEGINCGIQRPNPPSISQTVNCDATLGSIRTIGFIIGNISLFLVGGGGINIAVMWDANHLGSGDHFLLLYSVEAGAAVKIGISISDIYNGTANVKDMLSKGVLTDAIFSEATLDELAGLSGNLNANLLIIHLGASVSMGANGCPNITGQVGGTSGTEVGASITVSSTDVIYDSRNDTWYPNMWWLPR